MPKLNSLFLTSSCDFKQTNLTDSLIVQVDNSSNNHFFNKNGNLIDESKSIKPNLSSSCLDDFEVLYLYNYCFKFLFKQLIFKEVMEIMDQQFKEQLEILKHGTQWRELKSSNRRSSGSIATKPPINSLLLKNILTKNVNFKYIVNIVYNFFRKLFVMQVARIVTQIVFFNLILFVILKV